MQSLMVVFKTGVDWFENSNKKIVNVVIQSLYLTGVVALHLKDISAPCDLLLDISGLNLK
jgi:uncharacterized membrane protein